MHVKIPKLTLTYFPIAARAEPIRLAAAIGKIHFSHRIVDPKTWKDVKPNLPLGQLPTLEIVEEGKEAQTIGQSVAILRYLGKLGGLYPEDPIQALQVDSLMDTVVEATRILEITARGSVANLLSEEAWSKDEVLAIRKRLTENKERGLPHYLAYFEKKLAENGTGWLVGDSVTIADLQAYSLEHWIHLGVLDGIPPTLLSDYPLVTQHRQRIEELPAVMAWRAEHSAPYTNFDYQPE